MALIFFFVGGDIKVEVMLSEEGEGSLGKFQFE
jgi:hypothetical protein